MLLDLNILSDDGIIFLVFMRFSEDVVYLVYGLSVSGSDWVIIKVMCVVDRIL